MPQTFDDAEKLLEAMHAGATADNVRFMRREPDPQVVATLQALLQLAAPSFSAWCDGFYAFIEHFAERQESEPFPGSPQKLREALGVYLRAAFEGPFDEHRNEICVHIGVMAHQSGVNPFIFMSAITRLSGGLIDFLRAHLAPEPADLDALSCFSRMLALDLSVMIEALFRLDRVRREELAHIDDVTKLPDEKVLRRELQRRLEMPGERVPAVFLAFPKLPQLADRLGGEAADFILQEAALRLMGWEKKGWLIARARPNVFALLPPPGLSREAFDEAASILRRAFDAPVALDGNDVPLESVLGIVVPGPSETDAAAVLRKSETALRHAARTPDGQAVYDAGMERFSFEELALLKDLRKAIATGQFQLHYQPQIALDSGRVAGAEALARWAHPSKGFIPPGKFIPLAEKTFLIHALTDRLLAEAVRQAKAWARSGAPLTVSVNVASGILQDSEFPARIERLLKEEDLPAGLLALEITESAILADPERAGRVLHQLRDAGIRVAIDDFGLGYSSMAFLRTLPVDEVKIDRSFVFGMLKDPRDEGIVEAAIRLCRALGIAVSAEGVEDEATLSRLRELGCQYAQGYVLARPMPPERFEEWLRQFHGMN